MATQLSLKRKIIALLSLFYCVFSAAQLSESFEQGLPTAYSDTSTFTLASGVWTGAPNKVIRSTTAVKSGSSSLQLRNQTDAYVITPTVTTGVSTVTFYAAGSTTGGALQVNYSTDNGANWQAAAGSPFTALPVNIAGQMFTATINSNAPEIRIQFRRTGATVYIDDVVIYPSRTTTYNGTAWSGGAPDATKDAVIDADMTLTGVLNAKSLTVNAGKTLTLAGGSTLNVIGKITNDGSFIAEDGATVLQTENISNTGQFVVHKTSAPLYRNDFVLWGAPTTGMTLKEYSPNTLDNRFYTFDEPANAWAAIAASTQFVPGRAYQFRAPNNFSDTASQSHAGIYTGTLNNGTYTAAVTRGNQGYNLLGNPYPSTLDAETFLMSNPLLEGTLYFYMHSNKLVNGAYAGNNWAVYNASGAVPADNSLVLPTKNIAAGQGFMVTATASGNVAFNNGMRTSAAAPSHKNTANIDRIWLRLSDAEGSHSTILLAFVEGATDKFESNYDARAMGTEGHAVFTRVEGKRLKIDGRSSFRSTAKVLLGLDAKKPGTYTLSLSDMQGVFAAGQKVYITDRATNRTAELNTPFSFEAAAGMEEERFEISFEKSVMSVAETGRGNLQVFAAEAVLHIKANAPVDSLSVTDMSARKVLNRSNQSSELRIPIGHVGKGVYFVKVVSNGKTSIHKIVLK